MSRPWEAGIATGLGSLPGDDIDEASRFVLGEVGDLPYLPELPGRGLGADLIGRSAALLVDLPVEWLPGGWTLTSHPGRDAATALDWLRRDVDVLTEQAAEVRLVKVQVAGPVTLAAAVELPNLHKVLTDPGAFRDLAASLAEGVRLHVADIGRRLPAATVVLQVDEPGMPAALAGRVPTPSGYGTVRSLPASVAGAALASVLATVPPRQRLVHCCAADAPLRLFTQNGASAVSVDARRPGTPVLDALGELVDGGTDLWLGVIPGTDARISVASVRERVMAIWSALGFPAERLPETVVLTPACGLAGATPGYARHATAVLRDAAKALRD